MGGKILFISSTALLFLTTILHPAYADASAQLKEAGEYVKTGNYAEAEKIYQSIIAANLGTSDGLRAQQKLTILYVVWGKQTDAQVSLENLLTQYSQHELLPEAVTKVGDAYRKAENYTKAAELHRYVVDRWPTNEFAFWSQMDLVMCSEALRDVVGAQAAFEKLCTQYSWHQLMPKAICFLGDDYRRRGQHARALELYGQVLSNWPKAEDALWSQMGIAISHLGLGDYSTAQNAINKLRDTFSEDKRIPTAACLIGDAYRKLNRYKQAVELYKYVADSWPNAEYALWSQMGLAISSLNIGDFEAATSAVNKLCADFSKDERISTAACMVADEYRRLSKHDKARELYQYVVSNWPNTEYSLRSQMGLAITNIQQRNYDTAQADIDKLLNGFSKDERLSVAVNNIADEYRKLNKYEDASELYGYVVDEWPNSEQALWSQMGLAISNVRLEDDPNAEQAVEELLTRFSRDSRLAVAVCWIADEYRRLKKDNKACRLYQYVVDNNAKAEHALWSQMNLAISKIHLNDPNAEAAVNKLIADFSWSEYAARAIHDTAWEYRKQGNYGRANELDKYVIDHWPANVQAMWAKVDMAKTDILLGNEAAAEAVVNELIADFNDEPNLPKAIFTIGEEYYNRAFVKENEGQQAESKASFRKAIAIWERIIKDLPPLAATAEAYHFSGCCYERLGEYEKAAEYYQMVVDKWPDYEYAWSAQFLIAACYEELARSGQIPKADAAAQICRACDKLLTNYPGRMAIAPALF